jgi:hypothetical protein
MQQHTQGEPRNVCTVSVPSIKKEKPLVLCVDGRIILKWILLSDDAK